MAQLSKFIFIALGCLLVLATAVYIDCRASGGSVDACRVIFKQAGDRAMSIIPGGRSSNE